MLFRSPDNGKFRFTAKLYTPSAIRIEAIISTSISIDIDFTVEPSNIFFMYFINILLLSSFKFVSHKNRDILR